MAERGRPDPGHRRAGPPEPERHVEGAVGWNLQSGQNPFIRVLSVWTTVILSTVAGSSSRTPSTSLTVAAYIRASDQAFVYMFAAGNSAARRAPRVHVVAGGVEGATELTGAGLHGVRAPDGVHPGDSCCSSSRPVVSIIPAVISSIVNGAAYSTRATSPSFSSGSPIQALSPSGAATSSAKKVPSDLPV